MMELAGTEGVLVSGGALTGKSVQFFDLESKRCVLNSLFIPNLVDSTLITNLSYKKSFECQYFFDHFQIGGSLYPIYRTARTVIKWYWLKVFQQYLDGSISSNMMVISGELTRRLN